MGGHLQIRTILTKILPNMTVKRKSSPAEDAKRLPEAATSGERTVESSELLAGREELLIRHDGRLYRLRRTRLGKLILTA